MGFLAFLSGKKKAPPQTTGSKKTRQHGHSTKKPRSKRHSGASTTDTVATSSDSSPISVKPVSKSNEDIITEYIATKNRHGSVEELVSYYASPDTKSVFEDGIVMPAVGLMTEIRKTYLGFEDLRFNYAFIKEVKPGVVLVEDLVVTGTHTKDFGFGNFPVIPATHKYVILDAERLWFTMKDGKIQKQEITALGNLTGPPGMYMSIGGKMEMPPPSADSL